MKIAFRLNKGPKRYLLCERAYMQLKHAVVNGRLKAGERLVETKLADKMGISRTPVREAIHKLEREGLLCKLPTGGHAVISATEKDVIEIRGLACILLGYAAYLATSGAADNDLNALRRIVKQAENHAGNGNQQEFLNACNRFCNTLVLLSKNNRLQAIFEGLRDHAFRCLSRLLDSRRKHALLDNQRTLIGLMEKRQAARAEELARTILLINNDTSPGQRGVSGRPD